MIASEERAKFLFDYDLKYEFSKGPFGRPVDVILNLESQVTKQVNFKDNHVPFHKAKRQLTL